MWRLFGVDFACLPLPFFLCASPCPDFLLASVLTYEAASSLRQKRPDQRRSRSNAMKRNSQEKYFYFILAAMFAVSLLIAEASVVITGVSV
jgi:hypothetical protein